MPVAAAEVPKRTKPDSQTKVHVANVAVVLPVVYWVGRSGMATTLLTEIQQAQTRLRFLSRAERGALIVRILHELKTLRKGVLGNVPADRCVWIDTLIASVSSTISEIAGMQDAEFNRVLNEFEKLMATLQGISHTRNLPKTIH